MAAEIILRILDKVMQNAQSLNSQQVSNSSSSSMDNYCLPRGYPLHAYRVEWDVLSLGINYAQPAQAAKWAQVGIRGVVIYNPQPYSIFASLSLSLSLHPLSLFTDLLHMASRGRAEKRSLLQFFTGFPRLLFSLLGCRCAAICICLPNSSAKTAAELMFVFAGNEYPSIESVYLWLFNTPICGEGEVVGQFVAQLLCSGTSF